MLARSAIIALTLVSIASVASAATVTNVIGAVSVNRGSGFQPAPNGTVVAAGDRVSARPGASANVVFGPDCVLNVSDGQTLTVPADSPCAPGGLTSLDPNVVGGVLLAGAVAGGIALGASGGSSTAVILPVSP